MLYDVTVVGSGPAGAVAAYHTASSGLSTLLVDQATFPRDKACAGGLTTAACAYLPEPLPRQLSHCQVTKLSTWMGDHRRLHDKNECFMFTVSRKEFDTWLLNLAVGAGAVPHLGDRVLGYQRERDCVRIRTVSGEIQTRMVIGADGANSLIARQLRRGRAHPMGYCLQVEVPEAPTPDTIEIHYGLVPEGYGWVFPRPYSRMIGVGGVLGHFPQPNSYLTAILNHHGCVLSPSRQAHTIPIGGHWLPVVDDGVVLVGDAAGFVDPFTGEGIRYALWSGMLAAQTASEALRRQDVPRAAHLAGYEHACRSAIMPQLQHALRLSRAFFRFSRQIQPKLFGNPDPVEQLLDILQGRSSYPRFTRWVLGNLPSLLLH